MHTVHIKPSSGLVAFAAVQALILFVAVNAVQTKSCSPECCIEQGFQVVPHSPSDSQVGTLQGLPQPTGNPLQVNNRALNELKQQSGVPCLPCQNKDTSVRIPTLAKTQKSNAVRYQLALFLDQTAKSKSLLSMFSSDQDLIELKNSCDFQIYYADNPLYRARFAEVVPADQFPVVLFLRPDGGHVHAAGGNMIPNTGSELFSDFVEGYKLSKQVESAPGANKTVGAIKPKSYSWDKSIQADMRLAPDEMVQQLPTTEQCVDGNCEPQERVRPLDKLLNRDSPKNLIVWASPIEYAIIAVIGIVFVLIIAVALKRMGNP
jgi:hypothetical protein